MNILEEAEKLINGDRAKAYGSPLTMCTNIAKMWSVIFKVEITPEQVALAMIAMKICREGNKHSHDNLVDMAGYAGVLQKIIEDIDFKSKPKEK